MHPDIEKEEKELLEKHPAPPSKNPKIDLKKMKVGKKFKILLIVIN